MSYSPFDVGVKAAVNVKSVRYFNTTPGWFLAFSVINISKSTITAQLIEVICERDNAELKCYHYSKDIIQVRRFGEDNCEAIFLKKDIGNYFQNGDMLTIKMMIDDELCKYSFALQKQLWIKTDNTFALDACDYIRERGWVEGEYVLKYKISVPRHPIYWHGLTAPYASSDVYITLNSVEMNYEPHICKISFTIENLQRNSIRIWIKDYGIWLLTGDNEIFDDYKVICECNGNETKEVDFYMDHSIYEHTFWPKCEDEFFYEDYDEEECFSKLVFSLSYDFNNSVDVHTSCWIVDAYDIDLTTAADWAYDYDPDEEDNDEDDSDSYGDADSDEELDTSSWNYESVLRKAGYTVSQKEALSDYERQQILLSVMRRNLMSKWQIIEHIELQISLRRNNRMYSIAISKWERDLQFLRKI